MRSEKHNCKLYLIHQAVGGFYKIGISWSPKKRIESMQGCNPHELTLFKQYLFIYRSSAQAAEQEMHSIFKSTRITREWFKLKPKDLKAIDKYLAKHIKADRKDGKKYGRKLN